MRKLIAFSVLALAACEVGDVDLEDMEEIQDLEEDVTASLQGAAREVPVTTGTCKNTFDFEKEFVIRSLDVVENGPRTTGTGAWTFAHLVTELAGTRDGKQLAREWLSTWKQSPELNGEIVRGNASAVEDLFLRDWNAKGFALETAPFRLLAIALRPDTPGGPELRFVYGATGPKGSALPMTVAFEYRVTPAFMVQWHTTLRPLALGTPAYLAALETLTEQGIHSATGINGSALAQLRTNEAAIDSPWDLREFELTATAGGSLERARLAGIPRTKLDGDARLASGVTPAMETFTAIVPSKNFAWNVPGLGPNERFKFAMSTCNGCHSRETRTHFTHIQPREAGQKAKLSSFLLSRTCQANDAECKELEPQFFDPILPSKRFTVQDDRMAALNQVLAAANRCE